MSACGVGRYVVRFHMSKPYRFVDDDGCEVEGPARCSECGQRWPCEAVLLNREIERLTDQLADANKTILALLGGQ
jgi:hypothetical protein